MAAFVESDITVTFPNPPGIRIGNRKREVGVKLAFGNGVITYATGGIPIAGTTKYGLMRQLDYFIFHDQTAQGLTWEYDTTNKKLKAFAQGVTPGATGAADSASGALVTNSDGATETVVRAMGTTASVAVETGPLLEVKNTSAIPAQVLIGIAVGW